MHWKLKSCIQNGVSLLPNHLSHSTYYFLQTKFGRIGRMNPDVRLRAGVDTWNHLCDQGFDPQGKTFLEIGTGRVPLVPIAFWLLGASETVTVDLNPYLRPELVKHCIRYIATHPERISAIFPSSVRAERLSLLKCIAQDTNRDWREDLRTMGIRYLAPGDAAALPLPSGSADFQTSFTVFEHIPPQVLRGILSEGNRVVRDTGAFVHRIDYSDHFSHGDKSISKVNFLQYSDAAWRFYAGNRYMYMNRLRHDDFMRLFDDAGHTILVDDIEIDQRSSQLLRDGRLRLAPRFRRKTVEVLSITASWVVSVKKVESRERQPELTCKEGTQHE